MLLNVSHVRNQLPYEIDRTFNATEREVIMAAMAEIESRTCVSMRERDIDDSNWVLFQKGAHWLRYTRRTQSLMCFG